MFVQDVPAPFGRAAVAWVEFDKDSSRAFCPACGSSIGAIDDAPVVALLLGIFDKTNSADLIPAGHSYRSARPKWWHVEAVKPPT